MDVDTAKRHVCDEVDRLADTLVDVAHELHAHPELCFEEHHAHDLLAGVLEDEGLEVERHAYGLDTAFAAHAGTTGPLIAILCEYDALPEIGHACGHNVIGAAGLGAGLAAASVAGELGRVLVLGTPAEEGGGGKALLADRGAFTDVEAAMMVHPAGADLDAMTTIAIQQIRVTYHGASAHAAAFPHEGRNALDAAVLGYNNVAALRQHIRPEERVHGIFLRAGDAPNVVPERTEAHWYVRAGTLARLEPLKERVLRCLQAGADAAACRMEHEWLDPAYADLITNPTIAEVYRRNAATLGREVLDHRRAESRVVGSTDMGNVSYLVPSIHPMIKLAPPGVTIHTPEFARYTRSPEADRAVVEGAKIMAMSAVDLWLRPGMLEEAREELTTALDGRSAS